MAHHKLIVIGRLVSDPKDNVFSNGGRVAKFGLPIDFTRRKKNPETGQWEGDSFIINVDAFNKDNYKLADLVMQYLKKGSHVYVEGRLKNNEYTDKNNVKVARPVLVADIVEFLDGRSDGQQEQGSAEPMQRSTPRPAPQAQSPRPAAKMAPPQDDYEPSHSRHGGNGGNEDDIPF